MNLYQSVLKWKHWVESWLYLSTFDRQVSKDMIVVIQADLSTQNAFLKTSKNLISMPEPSHMHTMTGTHKERLEVDKWDNYSLNLYHDFFLKKKM